MVGQETVEKPDNLSEKLTGRWPRVLSGTNRIRAYPSRSLSKIRRIYCGCAGCGQIFRSFSLNRPHYSPQTIEKSDSNQRTLATIANLGQAPRSLAKIGVCLTKSWSIREAPCLKRENVEGAAKPGRTDQLENFILSLACIGGLFFISVNPHILKPQAL